jgi:hypothetical protein
MQAIENARKRENDQVNFETEKEKKAREKIEKKQKAALEKA